MKADMASLLTTIQHKIDIGLDINQLWATFTDLLHDSINRHIPHKLAKTRDKLQRITPEIKQLIRKRDRLYKKKKKSNNEDDINRYKKKK